MKSTKVKLRVFVGDEYTIVRLKLDGCQQAIKGKTGKRCCN